MGTRKKLKQVAERVDKIAKVINSSQANVMYANGFILGATSGSGGKTYTGGNGITVDNTANTISINTTTGMDDAILTGTTTVENATVSGDFTLQKGAKFTGGSGAALDIECETEFDGSSVSFTNNASLNVADNTTVTGLIKSLGNEAVSGQPYHFTYYYDIQPTANNIGVTAYTITLDNNKTLTQYPTTIASATTTTAGVMSASDKTKLDSIEASDTEVSGATEIKNLKIGTTNWKFPSGGSSTSIYQHSLSVSLTNTSGDILEGGFAIFTQSSTVLTQATLVSALKNYIGAATASNPGRLAILIGGGIITTGGSNVNINFISLVSAYNTSSVSYAFSCPTTSSTMSFDLDTMTINYVDDSVIQIH